MVTKVAMISGPARARRALLRARAVSLVLALATGGCSFMRLRPPPPPSTWPNPVLPDSSEQRCTTTFGPPILDTVVALGFGTISYVERDSVVYSTVGGMVVKEPSDFGRGVAVVFGIGALVAAASAVYGYVETSRCRRYQALFHGP
jgi:hypothetical protein